MKCYVKGLPGLTKSKTILIFKRLLASVVLLFCLWFHSLQLPLRVIVRCFSAVDHVQAQSKKKQSDDATSTKQACWHHGAFSIWKVICWVLFCCTAANRHQNIGHWKYYYHNTKKTQNYFTQFYKMQQHVCHSIMTMTINYLVCCF